MQIQSLGHVVIHVSDLEKSEAFYRDVVGLPVCAHYEDQMAFFTLGNHHDFAIMRNPKLGKPSQSGLAHVAFKIGDSRDDLLEAKAHLESHGVKVTPIDHKVTESLYFADPDGNGIEVYVDTADSWKRDPEEIAQGETLEL